MQVYKEFCPQLLKHIRKGRGLTQAALADAIGKSRQIINQYESGTTVPSPSTLVDLSAALSVDTEALMEEISLHKTEPEVNVHAVGFLADMVAVDLGFVSFRARASFVELGIGIQYPDSFETLRLYVSNEQEAARYTGALVFEIEGDSMEPLLRTGEKVIAWQVPESKWEQIHNHVCVVAFDDTVTIKAVRENELFTRNLLTLYAQNPNAGFLPVQRQQIQSIWRVEEFFDRPKIRL